MTRQTETKELIFCDICDAEITSKHLKTIRLLTNNLSIDVCENCSSDLKKYYAKEIKKDKKW